MSTHADVIQKCKNAATRMRKNALKMALSAGLNGAHLGAGLSIIEIMATLYCGVMKIRPEDLKEQNRDRFILSKGHGTLGYYTALEAAGIISEEQLFTFERNGGFLPGQPVMNGALGIDYSGGSLGLGLSYAVGLCLAFRKLEQPNQVYVLLGDGECNEGSIWEAAMSAAHYKLSNLKVIVDLNSLQSDGRTCDILNIELHSIWESMGWSVTKVADGHNIEEIYKSLTNFEVIAMPQVIIAHTTKGKGISFMENNNEWHHNRLSQAQFDSAMAELSERGD